MTSGSAPTSTVDRNPSGDPIASVDGGTIGWPITAIIGGGNGVPPNRRSDRLAGSSLRHNHIPDSRSWRSCRQDSRSRNWRSCRQDSRTHTERGIYLLNGSGVLAFITPNTFLKNKYTNKLREIVATKTYLRNIVLFYVRVFEDPSVDNVVFICQRAASSPLSTSHRLCVHEIKGARFADEVKRFRSFPQRNIQPPDYVFSFDASEEDAALLKKIETGCKRLGEIGGTYFGIQTSDRKKYVCPRRAIGMGAR